MASESVNPPSNPSAPPSEMDPLVRTNGRQKKSQIQFNGAKPIPVGWSERHVNINGSYRQQRVQLGVANNDSALTLSQAAVRLKPKGSGETLPEPRNWFVRKWEDFWDSKKPVPLFDDSGQLSSNVKTWVEEQLYSLKHDSRFSKTADGDELLTQNDWLRLRDEICNDLKLQGSKTQGNAPNNGTQSSTKQAIEEHTWREVRTAIIDVAKVAHDKMKIRADQGEAKWRQKIDDELSRLKEVHCFRLLDDKDWREISTELLGWFQRVDVSTTKPFLAAARLSVWPRAVKRQKERLDKLTELHANVPQDVLDSQVAYELNFALEKANVTVDDSEHKYNEFLKYDNVAYHGQEFPEKTIKTLLQHAVEFSMSPDNNLDKLEDCIKQAAENAGTHFKTKLEAYQQQVDRLDKSDIPSELLPEGFRSQFDASRKSVQDHVEQGKYQAAELELKSIDRLVDSAIKAESNYQIKNKLDGCQNELERIEQKLSLGQTRSNFDELYSEATQILEKGDIQMAKLDLESIENLVADAKEAEQNYENLKTKLDGDRNELGQLEQSVPDYFLPKGFLSKFDASYDKVWEHLKRGEQKEANSELGSIGELVANAKKAESDYNTFKTRLQRLDRLPEEVERLEQSDVPNELLPQDFRSTFEASRNKVTDHVAQGDYRNAISELDSIDRLVANAKGAESDYNDLRRRLETILNSKERIQHGVSRGIAKNMARYATRDFLLNDFRNAIAVVKSLKDFAASEVGQAMIKRLEEFADDPSLIAALNSIEAPYSNGPLNNGIRAAMGTRLENRCSTYTTRRAVLAAVLHGVPGDKASIKEQISTFKQLVDGTLKAQPSAKDEELRNREIQLTVPDLDKATDEDAKSKCIKKAIGGWIDGKSKEKPWGGKMLPFLLKKPHVSHDKRVDSGFAQRLSEAALLTATPGQGNKVTISLAKLLEQGSQLNWDRIMHPKRLLKEVAKLNEKRDQLKLLQQNPQQSDDVSELEDEVAAITNGLNGMTKHWRVQSISVQDRVDYLRARIRTNVDGENLLIEAYQNIDRSGIDNDAGNTAITIETQ